MRILMAVHHFLPRYTAGAEQHAYRLVTELARRGHEPSILCIERIDRGPVGGALREDDLYEGIPVRRLSFNLAAAGDPVRWEYDNPWVGEEVHRRIEELRPDVFHLKGGYLISGSSLRMAQALGVPSVVTLADFWFLCPRVTFLRSDHTLSSPPVSAVRCARCLGEEQRRFRLPARYASRLMDAFWRRRKSRIARIEARMDFLRDTLNTTDAVIAPSRFVHSAHLAAGIDAVRLHLSSQGHDVDGLTPEKIAKTSSSVLRVGYLGQIAWHKGVHVLIDAVRRLPDLPLQLRIYGNSDASPGYTRQLRRGIAHDDRIELSGTYSGSHELTRVLRSLDVVAVPSLWYENNPTVIAEALARRTPVVATDLGTMREVVRHGENGLLFRIGDAAVLAAQLRRLVEEPGLLASLTAGIGAVRSIGQEIDQVEEIYARILSKPTTRGAT